MKNLRKIDIGTIVTLFLAIIAGVFWLGRVSNQLSNIDVEEIDNRINNIQDEVNKTSQGRIDDLPIGSIVQSVLPLALFSDTVGQQGAFNRKTSKWSPCDNRSIAESALAGKGINKAPDLRGVFVRGLNSFSSDEPQPIDLSRSDPNRLRMIGSYQTDGVGFHTHTVPGESDWKSKEKLNKINFSISSGNNPFPELSVYTDGLSPNIGETRPKNVALYFYIKIN